MPDVLICTFCKKKQSIRIQRNRACKATKDVFLSIHRAFFPPSRLRPPNRLSPILVLRISLHLSEGIVPVPGWTTQGKSFEKVVSIPSIDLHDRIHRPLLAQVSDYTWNATHDTG